MEILNISIGGFRNIKHLKLDFGTITALVGLNGYGKSNVMDAIDFGFDFIHFPSLSRNGMMSSKQGIPILKSKVGQDFSFDIEVKLVLKKQSYYVNYGYSFSWKTDKTSVIVLNSDDFLFFTTSNIFASALSNVSVTGISFEYPKVAIFVASSINLLKILFPLFSFESSSLLVDKNLPLFIS